MNWQLACLDMAGTTVRDDGLVEKAFTVAMGDESGFAPGSAGYERAIQFVRATMGQSKIEVFLGLLGDENRAKNANVRFERAYAELVQGGHVQPIAGAESVLRALRDFGVRIALTTGFARPTQDAILDALRWRDLVDVAICPGDVARGRPYPDMILSAVLRLGVTDVRTVVVAGDTPSDIRSGLRSGAGIVAGVLTGTTDLDAFSSAGATHVLASITELPALLRVTGPFAV